MRISISRDSSLGFQKSILPDRLAHRQSELFFPLAKVRPTTLPRPVSFPKTISA